MSPRKFEELLEEMREAGLDESYISDLENAWKASPIRAERDEARAQAQAALDEANRYRSVVAASRFRDLGIRIKPDALRTPEDLDWTDEDKVRSWAQDSGLIDPAPPAGDNISDEERQAHERINESMHGAIPPGVREDVTAQIAAAQSPEEVMALVRAAGLPTPQQ